MRNLKDALRLKFEGQQSLQQIATALGISKGVVTKYAGLAIAARLDWPAIAAMDEASLERPLCPRRLRPHSPRAAPQGHDAGPAVGRVLRANGRRPQPIETRQAVAVLAVL